MRRVYVTYKSGKTKEFKSIGKAAEALQCVDSTVLRLSQGKAPTIAKAHNIESVEIKENRGVMHRINPRQGKHPLRVTNEKTGESFDCESLKEAIEKTRFKHYLHNCIDTGQFHWGWKFDTIQKPKSDIKGFDANNITNDQIRTIYKMAWYQMKKFMYWSNDLKEDAVQYAVEHVASKLSTGKWHSRTPDDSIEGWMWYEVRTWLSKYATKEIKWRELQAEGEGDEIDHIDKDRRNNRLENLRWATREENMSNVEHTPRMAVSQYTLDGKYVATHKNSNCAGRAVGLTNGAGILAVCRGWQQTAGGYLWAFASLPEQLNLF